MQKAENLLIKIDNSEISLGLLVSMIHRTRMIYLNDKMKNMDITAGQFPFIICSFSEEGISSRRTGSIISILIKEQLHVH